MSDSELDKNETATPFKLNKAHERGQVAKSSDFVSFCVFAVATAYFLWQGWELILGLVALLQRILRDGLAVDLAAGATLPILWRGITEFLSLLAPFLVALLLAALVGNVCQTGPVLSAEPVKPDWQRISPAAGLRKIFSQRTLFEGLRACIKLILLMLVGWGALKALFPHFYALTGLSSLGYLRAIFTDISAVCLKLLLILGFIALIDLFYNKREFARRMRMSRREVREELKSTDGDPRIRARLREIRIEMLKRSRAIRRTGDADLLVTNPTHIAIALRYRHGSMVAPQLVAKGTGAGATLMRAIARRNSIPVIRQPALARDLYAAMQVDDFVPTALYARVARIVVWVFAMRAHVPAERS